MAVQQRRKEAVRFSWHERVFSMIGRLPAAASGRQTLGENLAQINFVLPAGSSSAAEARALEEVRGVLRSFPQVDAQLVRPSVIVMRSPVAVEVFSDDLELLDRVARAVETALQEIPGIADVATTAEPGSPELCRWC